MSSEIRKQEQQTQPPAWALWYQFFLAFHSSEFAGICVQNKTKISFVIHGDNLCAQTTWKGYWSSTYKGFLFLFGPFLVLHWEKNVSDKYARGLRKKSAFFILIFSKVFFSFLVPCLPAGTLCPCPVVCVQEQP